MAVLKCKMCGGQLEINNEETVATCEYCGTAQTVPNVDDEKKLKLYERANKLRYNCDFDKAAGAYESIISEYSDEAEAYWGLILCKYGIEYVDDSVTGKKIPTCHRSSFDSVMDDSDFEMVMENSDSVARDLYRAEAKQIEEIRKGIIEVSGKEEPYDIFICYKETAEDGQRTIDSVLAQDVYDALTDKGYRVFFSRITLEDKLGYEYEPYIFAALNSAKVMLAFGTSYNYYNAVWVKNEWSRYLKLMEGNKEKHLIPCYKDLDAYDIPKEFAKLQAQDMGKIGFIQDLVRGIEKIISPKSISHTQTAQQMIVQSIGPNEEALMKRGYMAIEDCEWDKVKEYFEQVLNMNAECAEAYLGLAMAENKSSSKRNLVLKGRHENKNYRRAKQFAGDVLLQELSSYEEEYEVQKATEEEKLKLQLQKSQMICSEKRKQIAKVQNLISAGSFYTVGLKANGTVVARGVNREGQCNVSDWKDIVAVSAGTFHSVGLKKDGTVIAVGRDNEGQCNVSDWKDIVAVSAGTFHSVGLKKDGTVIAVGNNRERQCSVSDWKDIVAISACHHHTVGLKKDGTVVTVGENYVGCCKVYDWKDIVAISTGNSHTIGLTSIGKVVTTEWKTTVNEWENIVAISAGGGHTVGIKTDGTILISGVFYGENAVSEWKNIVAVNSGSRHIVGLQADGKVMAAGENDDNQCNVSNWKLFDSLDSYEEERETKMKALHEKEEEERRRREAKEAEERRRKEAEEAEERKRFAYRSQGVCQHCGGSFKGFFTKTCTRCGKVKDY